MTYTPAGLHPGLLEGLAGLKPEYMRLAPRPEDFPALVAKVTQLSMNLPELPASAVQSIQAPTLVIIGDSAFPRCANA